MSGEVDILYFSILGGVNISVTTGVKSGSAGITMGKMTN